MKGKPNIVYILADDMGYGDVSCLNQESKINTVNMDRLAREGVSFTDAHSGSAVCTPTRYGVLTGRYCWRSRLKNGALGGYSKPLIEKGRMTVASLLKKHGYKTACIGKWHLGLTWQMKDDDPEQVDFNKKILDGPNTNGFDYFFGISASLDMDPYVYIEDNHVTALPDRITENYEGGHRIPFIARWPEQIKPNSISDEIICLTDLMATCAAITGEELADDAGEDSYNILPAMTGAEYEGPIREATVHHSINGSFSIRQERWKLEMCPGSGGWSHPRPGKATEGLPPIQLYDMMGDVGEKRNVYQDHPDVVEALTNLLTDYVKNGRSTPGSPQKNNGPAFWPQLNWMQD